MSNTAKSKRYPVGKEWRRDRMPGKGIGRRARARRNPPMKIELEGTNHERMLARADARKAQNEQN